MVRAGEGSIPLSFLTKTTLRGRLLGALLSAAILCRGFRLGARLFVSGAAAVQVADDVLHA